MDAFKVSFQKLVSLLLLVFIAILGFSYLYHAHDLKALFSQSERCFIITKIEFFTGGRNANCH